METVILAESVSKRFTIHHNRTHSLKERVLGVFDRRHRTVTEDFWALRDIKLRVGRGESVGLVGRNGSGKSTLLKIIAGIYRPTTGRLLVRRNARIGTMIELGVGFHPELSGRENVYMNASVYGMSQLETDRIDALQRFLDAPSRALRGLARKLARTPKLGFAIAARRAPASPFLAPDHANACERLCWAGLLNTS